ncbi:MAG: SCP2 sterol-binding domain-containing protein [Pseudomonadota bacterium]
MSEILNKAQEMMAEKVNETGFDGSVKFDIEDTGVLRIEGGDVTLEDGESDVTILADADTLQELVSGELSPTSAFMSGRIKIEGDMGVAMKLSSLLG